MSGIENNSFEDYYKTDNFDDSELQARLYAEIYYETGETSTSGVSKTIQFNNVIEFNKESENMQHILEATEDSQKTKSIDKTNFAQIDTLTDKEINSALHEYNNENPEDSSETNGKESKESSSRKRKFSRHTRSKHQENLEKDHSTSSNDAVYSKYNVISKYVKQQKLIEKQSNESKRVSDSSDSEESIFEVPVPPKPAPLLINLQDSDDEKDIDLETENDPILKRWNELNKIYSPSRYPKREIRKTSNTLQDTSSKNSTDKFSYNNSTSVNPDRNVQTHAQETREDIVLNCTIIQKGAANIGEIKQLSKNMEIEQGNKLTNDASQHSKRLSPRDKSKGNNKNNVNIQRETSISPAGKKFQTKTQQNLDKTNKTLGVEDRKRQYNEIEQMRHCTQQSNKGIALQNNKEKKNESTNEFFKSMSEQMRDYYNSTQGQENFDVNELQRNMSKDPRMWAILDEDIMPCPSSRQRTRFWNVRCTNCQQDGHQRYDCSMPRKASCCYVCGMRGHMESRCPQKMCLTCGKRQSTFRKTCEYCRVLYCTMCNSVGHELKQCPDLWRRYHQTTDMHNPPKDPGNVMKSSGQLHCCNCTKRGHESSTCKEYRWSQHFPTPAAVTNYTDGPMYTPSNIVSSNPKIDSSSSKTRNTSTSQSINNIQHTSKELEPTANINTLNNNSCILPTPQKITCISTMEENLKSFSSIDQPRENIKITKLNEKTFANVIYCCGKFYDKYNKNARMIVKNISTFFINKSDVLNSLISREVAPVFFKTLFDKAKIEFEVKIGYTVTHQWDVTLQLLAMREYIEHLYDLLRYWLFLPDDEKDYGIDVSLPIHPLRMLNLMNSRVSQLKKMRFTCYAEHIGGENDPRWINTLINEEKNNLKKHEKDGSKYLYRRIRTKLWRLQTKLLMIVNTEPEPNVFVCMFNDEREKLIKLTQMSERLDNATYLKLVLIYNRLFVPHTPETLYKTIERFTYEENRKSSSQIQMTKMATSAQKNLTYNTYPLPHAATLQKINYETPSSIDNQQNNEILIERQSMNDIVLEMNKTTHRNSDETIEDYLIPQTPLNTEPESVKLKDPERNKDQSLTSKINIKSNILANKQNINMNDSFPVTKVKLRKEFKELRKAGKMLININDLNITNKSNLYNAASILIKDAQTFKKRHMMNAADEMQKHINNQTVKPKNVHTLLRLVDLERKYQRSITSLSRDLKN
ncbi:uncharacterized protein LOC105425248 isoform X2 [Pogonomyrmex barbatus]|uniref:Zinc finger CCHC domain-containing protein 7 n=1 Tax=Pogonomyrmex barbatus TaxID=144034 RepID=A0A6I9VYA6_9HYME|nr:uncharacterized protein LOC105425248 isoform X2 [Pogonomyrmex barbatus]